MTPRDVHELHTIAAMHVVALGTSGAPAQDSIDTAERYRMRMQMKFGNIDHTGGFVSLKNGVATSPPQHICYVNGVKCYADEARFGGIVIRKMNGVQEN